LLAWECSAIKQEELTLSDWVFVGFLPSKEPQPLCSLGTPFFRTEE